MILPPKSKVTYAEIWNFKSSVKFDSKYIDLPGRLANICAARTGIFEGKSGSRITQIR